MIPLVTGLQAAAGPPGWWRVCVGHRWFYWNEADGTARPMARHRAVGLIEEAS